MQLILFIKKKLNVTWVSQKFCSILVMWGRFSIALNAFAEVVKVMNHTGLWNAIWLGAWPQNPQFYLSTFLQLEQNCLLKDRWITRELLWRSWENIQNSWEHHHCLHSIRWLRVNLLVEFVFMEICILYIYIYIYIWKVG